MLTAICRNASFTADDSLFLIQDVFNDERSTSEQCIFRRRPGIHDLSLI